MLDQLQSYCIEWGLTVNVKKTAVLVFNPTGRLLKESWTFRLGESLIPSAREYCYLGITFTLSGSLKNTQSKLRQKGLRSYFALKRMIDIGHIRKTVLFKLFDTLIQPVVSYACQVWLPNTGLFKVFDQPRGHKTPAKVISTDPLESLHLSFLKWTLNVTKATSNAAVWGDCGRYPLGVTLSKTVYNFKERLEQLDNDNSPQLVRHAFREQKNLQLSWFKNLVTVQRALEAKEKRPLNRPSQIRAAMKSWFERVWEADRTSNKKLGFYNSIKSEFSEELYLKLDLSATSSKRICQLRTSSHGYNIETGRHGVNRVKLMNRVCRYCSTEDEETLELLLELPFPDPIIEDECHVLRKCPLYEDLRGKLLPKTTTYLSSDIGQIFADSSTIRDVGRFLIKAYEKRFPRKTTI